MLRINVPETEYYDGITETFITIPSKVLQLEHSLTSVSKWEGITSKAFIGNSKKTEAETYEYIRCMIINDDDDDFLRVKYLSKYDLEKIGNYINSPMTATVIKANNNRRSREIVTSELIYFWMVSYNIPFECDKWHLNKLLTLIQVCDVKNAKPKKENAKETMSRNAALNAARRKELNSSG